MFIQRAEADVEVFGLFFRSGPAERQRNRRLIKQWHGLRCHEIILSKWKLSWASVFIFWGDTVEKQDIISTFDHSGETKLTCSSQANWLYKLHLLHDIFHRCLWKSSDHLGEYKKEEKYRVFLNQMRAAGELTWTVILCGFEASGHVVFTVFMFQIWSNTYITNYAHHLLILGPVWMLACS